jgi:hypothetical protein
MSVFMVGPGSYNLIVRGEIARFNALCTRKGTLPSLSMRSLSLV